MNALTTTIAALIACSGIQAQTMIDKSDIKLKNDLMTPEALWAMGRIGGADYSLSGRILQR